MRITSLIKGALSSIEFLQPHHQSAKTENLPRCCIVRLYCVSLVVLLVGTMRQPVAAFQPAVPFLSQSHRCSFKRFSKRPTMSAATILVGDVSTRVGAAVLAASEAAIAARGRFTVAISGGSLPKLLAAGLSDAAPPLDKWTVFLADERIVPLDHEDSNYRLICEKIPGIQLAAIDPSLSAEECAKEYQDRLVGSLGESPVFDALLLGLGPDGHTCSLFPGHGLVSLDRKHSLTETTTFELTAIFCEFYFCVGPA